jgi:hypothetical protein
VGLLNDAMNDATPVNIALDVLTLAPGAGAVKFGREASILEEEAAAITSTSLRYTGTSVELQLQLARDAALTQSAARQAFGFGKAMELTSNGLGWADFLRRNGSRWNRSLNDGLGISGK